MVEFAFGVELFAKFLHRARFHSAVGGVAESFKQLERRLAQRLTGEGQDALADCFFEFYVIAHS